MVAKYFPLIFNKGLVCQRDFSASVSKPIIGSFERHTVLIIIILWCRLMIAESHLLISCLFYSLLLNFKNKLGRAAHKCISVPGKLEVLRNV